MIRQLPPIRNVGCFADARTTDDALRFEALTLIFAEHGRGKTTLRNEPSNVTF